MPIGMWQLGRAGNPHARGMFRPGGPPSELDTRRSLALGTIPKSAVVAADRKSLRLCAGFDDPDSARRSWVAAGCMVQDRHSGVGSAGAEPGGQIK